MINIQIKLWGQLKKAEGSANISLKTDGLTLEDVIKDLSQSKNADLADLLLNVDGSCRHSILAFQDDEQIEWCKELNLKTGITISLMSPIAGG